METKHLTSWESLLDEVQSLRDMRAEIERTYQRRSSQFLFRGQRNADWSLETTLERSTSRLYSFADYFKVISAARPQIETFTSQRWDLSPCSELIRWAGEYDNLKRAPFPGYEYLVYLRHHGFPSPLLDWTRSLYIAAYFAFEDAIAERATIYVFWEDTALGKSASSSAPQLHTFGPYVRSHPRHFNQQSAYSICCDFTNNCWKFTKHDSVTGSSDLRLQDKLYKFTIPVAERTKVLGQLDSMNINAYSLFQSEESLVRTVAVRELLLRESEL